MSNHPEEDPYPESWKLSFYSSGPHILVSWAEEGYAIYNLDGGLETPLGYVTFPQNLPSSLVDKAREELGREEEARERIVHWTWKYAVSGQVLIEAEYNHGECADYDESGQLVEFRSKRWKDDVPLAQLPESILAEFIREQMRDDLDNTQESNSYRSQ